MNRLLVFFVLLTSFVFITSCNHDATAVRQLQNIKQVGDSNQEKAMLMLDSVKEDEQSWTQHTRMTCDLLDIRLHDKAYIPATSDLKIKRLIAYFDKHGSNIERQETYYYAGSIYRDLQNYPQAITYFQQSKDMCDNEEPFDSVILRNTYSNLGLVYFNVQDYVNATKMLQQEYNLAKRMGTLNANTVEMLGASQLRSGDITKSKLSFLKALKIIPKDYGKNYLPTAFNLLYHFSKLKMRRQALACYDIIHKYTMPLDSLPSQYLICLGEYFMTIDDTNSALDCYNMILEKNDNLENIYDASKLLFKISNKFGNIKLADYYASKFIQASDTLNLGKRQQLAATANNLYQYHRDQRREKIITEKNATYKNFAFWTLATLLPLLAIVILLYLYRSHKSMKEILSQRQILSSNNDEIARLKGKIEKQQKEIQSHKAFLDNTRVKLQNITEETELYKAKIKEQEMLLEKKIKQNRSLLRLIHKADMEENAEDIVNTIRQTSHGKHKMLAKEWNMLIQAVDELYPEFSSALADKLGRIDKNELHVCYLMRIGLTNPQIINVTALPHSTVWRWTKKFEWITTWKG